MDGRDVIDQTLFHLFIFIDFLSLLAKQNVNQAIFYLSFFADTNS